MELFKIERAILRSERREVHQVTSPVAPKMTAKCSRIAQDRHLIVWMAQRSSGVSREIGAPLIAKLSSGHVCCKKMRRRWSVSAVPHSQK